MCSVRGHSDSSGPKETWLVDGRPDAFMYARMYSGLRCWYLPLHDRRTGTFESSHNLQHIVGGDPDEAMRRERANVSSAM